MLTVQMHSKHRNARGPRFFDYFCLHLMRMTTHSIQLNGQLNKNNWLETHRQEK